jgi:hypothetical protein
MPLNRQEETELWHEVASLRKRDLAPTQDGGNGLLILVQKTQLSKLHTTIKSLYQGHRAEVLEVYFSLKNNRL